LGQFLTCICGAAFSAKQKAYSEDLKAFSFFFHSFVINGMQFSSELFCKWAQYLKMCTIGVQFDVFNWLASQALYSISHEQE